ncbi:MAG TPA: hotdog fold thioesterase [Thermoanaerobaculaceae bacterium]|nr:hotdog fold thioesterase [Thermoanaerobaculaceae bacterium]HRS16896.1 hotdog fold thioesterase [Thermoanaerobaculaceae bacterium]
MEPEVFKQVVLENLRGTALEALGVDIVDWRPDCLAVAVTLDGRHKQPEGFLHGGISALLAETAASFAAAAAVDLRASMIFGVDLNITHLRPLREGRLVATSRPLRRGRSTQVFAVDLTDEAGHLVAAARCTVAVRPRPTPPAEAG